MDCFVAGAPRNDGDGSYERHGLLDAPLRGARESWGARDFILKDPDGNLLFAGPGE
jgi:hypothetical protein